MKSIKRTTKRVVKKLVPSAIINNTRILQHIHAQVDNISKSQNKIAREIDKLNASKDSRLDQLHHAASKVESYQPLYNVSGVIDVAARSSKNRAIAIESYLTSVKGMRILDLGSSLGYICFYFADRGAITEGWEYNPKNVTVEKLTQQINGITNVNFLSKEFNVDTVKTLDSNKYDVALILSVFHHIIYYHGLEFTQQLVAELLDKVPVLIMELAKKGEDKNLFWNDVQPKDELAILDLVKDQVDIKQIGSFGNHLSSNKRPLYAVKKKQSVTVNNKNYSYDYMSHEAYKDSPVTYSKHQRRYYFNSKYIIKEYIFSDSLAGQNQRQIINEINVLNNLLAEANVYNAPKLLDFELDNKIAKVVLSKATGSIVSSLGVVLSLDEAKIIAKDVLASLGDLRKYSLYHNDVRSWNIVFNKTNAWLIDYGLATPIATDDDIVSLIWALHAGLTGEREGYGVNKSNMPDKSAFVGDSDMLQFYNQVKSGTKNPADLLGIFKKANKGNAKTSK